MACLILLSLGTSVTVFAQAQDTYSYFIALDGRPSGPVDVQALRLLISTGHLTRESYVWREGMANWELAGRVPELVPLFSNVTPPIPSAAMPTYVPAAPPGSTPAAPRTASATPPPSGQQAQVYQQERGMYGVGGGALIELAARNGMKGTQYGESVYMGFRALSFGGYGFFDLTYTELDISFAYGLYTDIMKQGSASGSASGGNGFQVGISALGKYPIELGAVTFFPLLGVNYNMVVSISSKDDYGNTFRVSGSEVIEYFSQFGFQAGAGLDYYFSEAVFLRTSALFQLRIPIKSFREMAKADNSASATLGLGPRLKIGVGHRF